VSKSLFAGGRSIKLAANELGGTDYISLNLYLTRQGLQLFPCEMSIAKVITFLSDLSLCDVPQQG